MNDAGSGGSSRAVTDLSEDLRREFIDEAAEVLHGLDVVLDSGRHGRTPQPELIVAFRRAAVNLRGQAANHGLRALATVARRLDEYLAQAHEPLPPRAWDDLQAFLDLMLSLVEGRQPADGDPSGLVRALPVKLGFDLGDIEVRNVEVMLVMPHGAQTRFVEREMQQCGYRVSVISDTIDAFAQVVQIKPDLIIVSALMPHLDGIDLAIGLASMPATRNIPIAVITSLGDGDDRLALLPRKVPVVHKGPSFGDDLFKALDDLFLI
ncbi:Hpt domain-containing protein [Magnetospirillum sp. UT-4]|uniref:Hpt domain-containing protein n=1 Tax=Magnetospirillum sp. UT-4 TaxID=2681467 RepID=UPI0013807515|nr:Hpt domain-containing protein [Magnetospirillum sp. UT-4]CAA7623771.1 putative Two-component response regulator [Magnetospirillum sp. UT-4]